MKTSCAGCAKSASCTLQYDEERRAQCPILNADNEPLRYRVSDFVGGHLTGIMITDEKQNEQDE